MPVTLGTPSPATAPASRRPLALVGRDDVLADWAVRLGRGFAVHAAHHDRNGTFPFENFAALHGAGLLALTVPARLGGHDAGLGLAVRVVRSVARGDASTALVLAMQLIHHALARDDGRWPKAVHERLCRDAVRDGALVNALRVEPALGTPARGGLPATVAARTARGWRLDGHKIYATGLPGLTWLAVWACTDEAEPRVGTFLVPAGTPGIAARPTWDHLGMRATCSHDVLLEGVEIPADHAVDIRPPQAWTPDPAASAWNAVLVAAVYDGVARAARDWLVGYLQQRRPSNLGAPLSSLPRFQVAVGEIDGWLLASDRLLAAAAAALDAGSPPSVAESGLVKTAVTGHAVAVAEAALRLTGNPGLSRHNPLERHVRDALCGRVHTPQDDTVFAAAGGAVFAEPLPAQEVSP